QDLLPQHNLPLHYLLLPQTTAFNVTVTDGAGTELSFSPVTVSRTAPAIIPLSSGAGSPKGPNTKFLVDDSQLATVQTDEGLILTANKAFFTSIRISESAQAGFLTSKGTAGFGKEFRTGHIWNTTGAAGRKAHVFSFMATEDATTVTISDFGAVDFENISESGDITVSLDAGDSYVMAAFVDKPSTDNLNNVNGTRISSNKNIVVNSGSWLGGSPGGTDEGRDIGLDQIAPIEQTGFEYILVKGQGIASENVIVVAHTDGTDIFLNGASSPANASPLNAGEFHRFTASDYSANENMYITSNQPVYVYQGLNGANSTNERQLGMNYMPPIICLGGTNVDIPNINQLGNPVIQIIAEAGEQVTITDGSGTTDVTSSARAVTGNSNYVTYKLAGYTGNVTVESPRPIRVSLTIESGNIGGAGFFSGFTTSPVIETPSGYDATSCIPDNLPVTLTATGFDSYQWYRDGIILTGETNASVSVDKPGVYTAAGTIAGCVSSEQSFPLSVTLCPGDLGVAKDVVSVTNVSGDLFDVVFDLIVTNYSPSNPAPNMQLIDDITDGLPSGATASIQSAPTVVNGSFTTGGISSSYNGTSDIALLTTSLSGADTELAAASTVTVRFKVRVDMSAATSPAYAGQAVVTTAISGPNDGITTTFDNQDFSDSGSNPDPNGNGDPTEAGENDITEVCLSNTTISYSASTYYSTGSDPTPIINGVSGGTFSAPKGLVINSTSGEIDVSASIVDDYIVTYSFGGLCPSTTSISIALNPPAEPTVINQITNNTTPTLTGTAVVNVGESLEVLLNGQTYVLGDGNLSISGTTWTLIVPVANAIGTDGIYDVTATHINGVGTRTDDTTNGELEIDTDAPEIVISGQPSIINNNSSYTVNLNFDEDITGLQITDIVVTNASLSNLTSINASTYTIVVLPAGTGNITIDFPAGGVKDLANNNNLAASQVLTIYDDTAPATPTVNALTTSDNTPVVSGTAEIGSTVTVIINGVTFTTTADASGNWSVDTETATPTAGGPFTPLTDGDYDVAVTSTDAAGNSSSDATSNEVSIDTTAPTAPIVNLLTTNDVTPVITGTNGLGTSQLAGETLTVTVNGATYTVTPDASGNWSVDTETATPTSGTLGTFNDGTSYEVVATVTDAASNSTSDATSNEVSIDTTAPATPTVNTLTTSDNTPVLSGTAEIGSTVVVVINGVTFTTTADASGDWSVDTETATPTAG
ncbi:hypothetical protein C9994_13265, partial [Marivirga lumbricoides]